MADGKAPASLKRLVRGDHLKAGERSRTKKFLYENGWSCAAVSERSGSEREKVFPQGLGIGCIPLVIHLFYTYGHFCKGLGGKDVMVWHGTLSDSAAVGEALSVGDAARAEKKHLQR